jgi:hypothetical protein
MMTKANANLVRIATQLLSIRTGHMAAAPRSRPVCLIHMRQLLSDAHPTVGVKAPSTVRCSRLN